jgi:hypothetical protein
MRGNRNRDHSFVSGDLGVNDDWHRKWNCDRYEEAAAKHHFLAERAARRIFISGIFIVRRIGGRVSGTYLVRVRRRDMDVRLYDQTLNREREKSEERRQRTA